MQALSVCQPSAELILLGQKRVANRNRRFSHRGRLLIHASKSKEYLRNFVGPRPTGLVFGAIVGDCEVVDCLSLGEIFAWELPERLRWLRTHEHVEGPFCLVIRDARRLIRPIPFRGNLGIFAVPDSVLAGAQWLDPVPDP